MFYKHVSKNHFNHSYNYLKQFKTIFEILLQLEKLFNPKRAFFRYDALIRTTFGEKALKRSERTTFRENADKTCWFYGER